MRGIVDRWLEDGIPVPSSHFSLMNTRLDFSALETRYPYASSFLRRLFGLPAWRRRMRPRSRGRVP
jgi:hypothetical protein